MRADGKRQRFAVAYFSSEVSTDANGDLKLREKPGEGERQLSCRTHNGVEWCGRRDSQLLSLTRLVLVTRNRRSGKVKVVPSVEAFRFTPVSKGQAASAAALARRSTAANGTPTRAEKRAANQALYEEFGSNAKKRRIAESKRLNASMTTQEAKEAATKSMRRQQQQQQQQLTPQSPAAALLPAFDASATVPSGVYSVDSLCPASLNSSLLPEAERLAAATQSQAAEWRESGEHCDLVLRRLARAPTDRAERLRYCTLLAMLAYMRKFYSLGFKQVNRKNPLPDAPESVSQHLIDQFTLQVCTDPDSGTPSRNRALPPMVKDKQLIYIIVLCLTLDGFSTELQGLQQEFKVSKERLRKLALSAGCEIATEKIGSTACRVARLKAPLKLPGK